MTRRGRPRKHAAGAPPAVILSEHQTPEKLVQIQVIAKRVTGDNKKRHLKDERLFVGDDVSPATAKLMVESGLAIEIDGKMSSQIDTARHLAEDKKRIALQKQNADAAMSRHDNMSPDERAEAQHHNPEQGEDVE